VEVAVVEDNRSQLLACASADNEVIVEYES
jgi:hypothetical protein